MREHEAATVHPHPPHHVISFLPNVLCFGGNDGETRTLFLDGLLRTLFMSTLHFLFADQ